MKRDELIAQLQALPDHVTDIAVYNGLGRPVELHIVPLAAIGYAHWDYGRTVGIASTE